MQPKVRPLRLIACLTAVALVAAIVAGLASCTPKPKPGPSGPAGVGNPNGPKTPESTPKGPATGEPIKIGVLAPLTGDAATYGKAFQRGADLAADRVLAGDEPGTSPVALVYEDTAADPKTAVSAYGKLVSAAGIRVLVGPMFSHEAKAVASLAERDGVTLVSPTAASRDVPAAGPHVFTMYPSSEDDGRLLASFARDKLTADRVAVVFEQAEAMVQCKDAFVARCSEAGATVVCAEGLAPGTVEVRAVLHKLAAARPDAVLVAANLPTLVAFLKQGAEQGARWSWMAISTAYDEKLFDLAGGASDGLYVSGPFFAPDGPSRAVRGFAAAYAAKYGEAPNVWAAYGYDSVRLIAAALYVAHQDTAALPATLPDLPVPESVVGFEGFNPDRTAKALLRMVVVRGRAFVNCES